VLLAFSLNVLTLFLTAKKRYTAAWAILLVAGTLCAWQWIHKGPEVDIIAFVSEGVLCSLALALCQRRQCSAGACYMWGALPSLLFVALVMAVPRVSEVFHNDLLNSWKAQGALMAKLHLQQAAPISDAFVHWLSLLFPAYWLLTSLGRIWMVRQTLGTALFRSGNLVARTPFVQLRIHDAFLWVVAAGLFFELLGVEKIRIIGHNLLLFSTVLYLLQGFAVVQSFFFVYKISFIYVLGFYGLTIMTQAPLIIVGLIGFTDTWIEFRSRMGKSAPQN
jgi:hypothetical protein